MKIFISIFAILILLIFTSKIKINVISLNKLSRSSKINFNVNVGLYLLGIMKISGITFKNDGMHFLSFVFSYPKIGKVKLKSIEQMSLVETLKILDLKIEKFNLNLRLGCEDMMITVFSVFAISTILSIMSAKNCKNINLKNYYYKITPIYNTNTVTFKLSSQLSVSLKNIFKLITSKKAKADKNYKIYIRAKSPIKI